MGSFKHWILGLLGLFVFVLGIYVGGILVMQNYAMPEIYKLSHPYQEYKTWKKDGLQERWAVSIFWPLIVFEWETPYDYDNHKIDNNP